MNKIARSVLVTVAVFGTDGKVDFEATAENLRLNLEAMENEEKDKFAVVAKTVGEIFDEEKKGENITGLKQLIGNRIGQYIKVNSTNREEISDLIDSYMARNTGEYGKGLFGGGGKGRGGTWRWSDKASDSKEVKASLEKATQAANAKAVAVRNEENSVDLDS